MCGSVCLYFCLGLPDASIIWLEFSFIFFYVNLFSLSFLDTSLPRGDVHERHSGPMRGTIPTQSHNTIILRFHPYVFFLCFALIFYIEALSSYLILRLRPHCYILRLCSSVWGFGLHCCWPLLLCLNLYCFFGLFVVICVWFCLFVFLSWVTRFKYYLAWIFIHFFLYIFLMSICLVFNRATVVLVYMQLH